METNIVYQEDCIEGMKKIPSNSIDLVLTDPPYGITACEWDKPIDLEKFWVEIKRIIKLNGAIVMTASQPFTTDLINSNREWFKYELIWEKNFVSGFLNSKKRPLVKHENILIFYEKQPIYNPQLSKKKKENIRWNNIVQKNSTNTYGKIEDSHTRYKFRTIPIDMKYPDSILPFKTRHKTKRENPTEKPVELFKWLIKTYSNENQLVLDCFGGSGTTAIACIETNRQYILFENNPQYFKIINDRIQSAKSQTLLSQPSAEGSLIGIKLNMIKNGNQ